jgi:TolB-like protein/Tfp pilus assembly protein PilF/tRNA A-37 threonylcarbamoyl transferase component Bud32
VTSDLRKRLEATLGDSCTIESELGRGGMSRVFLATETGLGRRIVVKVLPPELAAEVSIERFRREIQVAARLNHPHIVPLLNATSEGGLLYYTMPFVEGESLRSLIDRDKQLPVDLAVQFAREASDALAFAHERGVIHRDIKPDNILLSDGHAVVTDFGIARAVSQSTGSHTLTSATVTVGTPAYMSPEQASAEPDLDGRTDIYSLSCVMYEMLVGEVPFKGPSQQGMLARKFSETAPRVKASRADIPDWLDEVVAKGLERDPADRFQTAREYNAALAAVPPRSTGAEVQPPAVTTKPDDRFPKRGVIVAIALFLAAVAGYLILSSSGKTGSPEVAPAATGPQTIAVMPFTNLSADPDNAFFADGMTEEVINALSGIEGLRVAARSSVFALRNSNLDARTLGDTLGVGAVLEGSVRRSGSRLRVTTQLVNTSDGYQMWSEDFDRELRDVFDLQDEIARAIVSALSVRLVRTGARVAALQRPTGDSEAYDLYLRGQFFLNHQGTPGIPEALEMFERALSKDSAFSRAYAGIASARTRLGILAIRDPDVEMPLARAAAIRALELDSTLAEAHSALAHLYFVVDWNHEAAERAFRKAIALDPDDAYTRILYGISLLDVTRFKEAEREFRVARELEPLLPHPNSLLGRYFVAIRQPDSAIKYLEEATKLGRGVDLGYQQLGHAYLQKGMKAEAIAAFREAASLSGARDSAHLVYAYAVTGDRAEAEKVLRQILSAPAGRYLSPVDMAIAYAGLGRKDEAFQWLERGVRERGPFMDNIRVMPGLESLRSDSRFARILRMMQPRAGN